MAELIRKVLAPTPNKAAIVTTNYDRLTEYAADGVGATTVTGFEGSLIKKLELPSIPLKTKRTRARERIVDIWKVHGSLDWFVAPDGTIVAFPLTQTIPNDFQPLIVPPGKEKYSSTHDEPYRTIIAEADKAFVQAGAYLCVGYGFNDEHILTFSARLPYHVLGKSALCSSVQPEVNVFRRGGEFLSGF